MASKIECLFHHHTFDIPNTADFGIDYPCVVCGRVRKSPWSGELYIRDKYGRDWYYKDVVSGRVKLEE